MGQVVCVVISVAVVTSIRKIGSNAPVGFNSNTRYTRWYIEICALGKDAAADAVEVFSIGIAVGIVIIRVVVIGLRIGAFGSVCHKSNLPARHHTIACIVSITDVIVIWQLHLVVIEVVVVKVLVGTL